MGRNLDNLREWRQKDYQKKKEHYAFLAREYRREKQTAQQRWILSLKAKYNITVKQWDEMLANQNGKCPICKIELTQLNWCVDHDHETGRNRGILCKKCNTTEGQIKNYLKNKVIWDSYLRGNGQ